MALIKQKLAFKEVLKGSSISSAMRKVGYAATTASTTGKLTNTRGWQELLNKHVSEAKLTKVLDDGLKATFTDKYNEDAADYATRHKYLETGLKVRGRLKEPDHGDTFNTVIIANEQAARIARRALARLSGSEELPD